MIVKCLLLVALLPQAAINGPRQGWDVQAQLDGPKGQIVVWVENNLPHAVQVTLDELTWNDAAMKQRLPNKATLAARSKKVWRFSPVHSGVARFGDRVAFSMSITQKGGAIEKVSDLSGVSGVIPGIAYQPMPQDSLDLKLTTSRVKPRHETPVPPITESELFPIEVRNVRLMRGTAVVAEVRGVHTIPPKGELLIARRVEPKDRTDLSVTYEYRLTPWSEWRRSQGFELKLR